MPAGRLTEYIPPMEDLDEQAKLVWKVTLNTLILSEINTGDLMMLRTYCKTYSLLTEIEAQLSVKNMVNEEGKIDPAFVHADKLRTSIKAYATCLKLTPASRSNDKVSNIPGTGKPTGQKAKLLNILKS